MEKRTDFFDFIDKIQRQDRYIEYLEEEIKQLEIDKIHWRDLYWEECEKNKKLEEENKKLKHKNELQEKALIKLCLKHHYDSIIIEGEEVIDMENYTVVENKKPKEEKLF